jgi:putative nucleotidyltransferase with HDIG domain
MNKPPTGPIKRTAPLPPLNGLNAISRLTRLYDIVRSLNSIIHLDTLLNQIVASAAEMMDAKGSALLMVEAGGKQLRYEVTSGRAAAPFKGTTIPVDERSVEAAVVLYEVPCIENNVSLATYPLGQASNQFERTVQKIVCVPLRTQDHVTGVLSVHDKVSGEDFDKDDVQLLEALADAAVVALENVRLYEEERRQAQLLTQAYQDLNKTYRATLLALTGMLDTRDAATHGHSLRVAAFTLRLAMEMGIRDPLVLRNIEQGALLHDVGKIGVRDDVLRKTGPLDSEDWREMKSHPELGFRMLRNIEFLREALPIVRHHHEHWDGSGYPLGLKGDEIPLEARIFAVADAFDAITSERPYSRARTYEEAVSILYQESGTRFDPTVVGTFMTIPAAEWQRIRERVAKGS